MSIIKDGYYPLELLEEVMWWIKDYPKDNDPKFKITESGVTIRFSGGHLKVVPLRKILEKQNKCLVCALQPRCGAKEEFDCKTHNYRWFSKKK